MAGKKGNTLERWEVAIVKMMQARGGWNDQEILAYFTRPQRTAPASPRQPHDGPPVVPAGLLLFGSAPTNRAP